MKRETKKTIALVVGGTIVGWMLGNSTKTCPRQGGAREEPDIPQLQRIAGDLVNMCEQITPVALQIEASLADDREIDAGEAYAMYQQFRTLSR